MRTFITLTLLFLYISVRLSGQTVGIDRSIENEFKMTFPSIYFKHNSTEYARMPYSVDSSFNYIKINFTDNINALIIWRDTTETEALTNLRIKKLKSALNKYLQTQDFEIYSMDGEQKLSRQTIKNASDSLKVSYLITLNSVFEISRTRLPLKIKKSHILQPRIWCKSCWKNGFHLNKQGREARKKARKKGKLKGK